MSIKLSPSLMNISNIKEKLCEIRYIIKLTIIVIILLINVEKKNTIESKISSFRNVKSNAQSIREVISIPLKKRTHKYNND
jgi:hypothetical protein